MATVCKEGGIEGRKERSKGNNNSKCRKKSEERCKEASGNSSSEDRVQSAAVGTILKQRNKYS